MVDSSLRAMAERLAANIRAGERQQGQRLERVAVSRYLDEDWLRGERESLFGARPLCLAHASEVAAPGSVLRFDATGLPVLIVRDHAGVLHGLLNVCRHRGMRLVEERACVRRTLSCPYHGWTYDLDGQLRSIAKPEAFDGLDRSLFDLVRIPVAESGGFIWGVLKAGASLDIEAWLGPLAQDMSWAGIPDAVVFRRFETERACNWKLVVEAFMESYHIRVLHRDSIYPFFLDAQAVWDIYGPHQRMVVARRLVGEGDIWSDNARHVRDRFTFSHLVFPNLIIVIHPDYVSAISLWPLAPNRTRWSHAMLIPRAKSAADWTPHWDKTMNLLERRVFQQEDLYAAEGIQEGLASGANTHVNFGTLETLLAEFHHRIDEALQPAAQAGVARTGAVSG